MTIPEKVQHVHLIAICGTAMGALAGMFKAKGFRVTGSDENVYPPISTQLNRLGIEILQGYCAEHLHPAPDLVIVGNAVRRDNPEAQVVREKEIPYLSLPQALFKFFMEGKRSIVVTGTHGKTTISSLLAWVWEEAGWHPSFLVGGILKNYDANFKLGSGPDFIVEGDEYDSAYFDKVPKFLHYHPQIALFTSCEFDHVDIYQDLEQIKNAFQKFLATVPSSGTVIACRDYELVWEMVRSIPARVMTYGFHPEADWRATEIDEGPEGVSFLLQQKDRFQRKFFTPLPGRHNLQNLLGVLAAASLDNDFCDVVEKSLRTFQGIKRRQELRGKARGITVIDDFAHHPTSVKVTLAALKARFPGSRLWAVFEPRTATSRRNVFQSEYTAAFSAADVVIIADVFRAELIPSEERFSPDKLVDSLCGQGVTAHHISGTDKIIQFIHENGSSGDVVAILSNGGFDNIHDRLLQALQQ